MIGPMVSLIIPAYNEENTIRGVIDGASEIMTNIGLPFEIIVVDDGSTDNTLDAAYSAKRPVKIYSNNKNLGKGFSIRKGVFNSNGDIIVTIDADGEHQPREIPLLLGPILRGLDIVSGSRFLSRKGQVTTMLHEIGNHLFNISIMILTGRKVTDSQTGFRAIKKEAFDKMELQSDGFEIETEITVKSLLNGFSFVEVPIGVKRREYDCSKIKILPDSKKIVYTILKSATYI